MTNNPLYTYLDNIRPLISPTAVERAANLPNNALGKHYLWRDGNSKTGRLALHHAPAIYKALAVFVPPDFLTDKNNEQ